MSPLLITLIIVFAIFSITALVAKRAGRKYVDAHQKDRLEKKLTTPEYNDSA